MKALLTTTLPVRPSGGTQFMSLSLFLLILAFFIMLVGISDFSEIKVSAAIESIDETFEVDPLLRLAESAVSSRRGDNLANLSYAETVNRLFEAEFPVAEVRVVNNGDILQAVFSRREIFGATAESDRRRAALIARLGATVPPSSGRIRHRVDVLMGLEGAGVGAGGPARSAVSAGSGFARQLIEAGVRADQVSVAIDPGQSADEVILQFIAEPKVAPIALEPLQSGSRRGADGG